jgi:hypothetical protein
MRGILWAVLQSPLSVLPVFDWGKPHHITLFYDVEKTQYQDLIDIEFEATAIAHLCNKDIQAIAFLMPDGIPHKPNPHLTISYREGIKPVKSNELMVINSDRVITLFSQKLNFKIEFFEFPECQHHWRKNGTKNGLQKYSCKLCGKSKTEGDRPIGRQAKLQ